MLHEWSLTVVSVCLCTSLRAFASEQLVTTSMVREAHRTIIQDRFTGFVVRKKELMGEYDGHAVGIVNSMETHAADVQRKSEQLTTSIAKFREQVATPLRAILENLVMGAQASQENHVLFALVNVAATHLNSTADTKLEGFGELNQSISNTNTNLRLLARPTEAHPLGKAMARAQADVVSLEKQTGLFYGTWNIFNEPKRQREVADRLRLVRQEVLLRGHIQGQIETHLQPLLTRLQNVMDELRKADIKQHHHLGAAQVAVESLQDGGQHKLITCVTLWTQPHIASANVYELNKIKDVLDAVKKLEGTQSDMP